MPTVRSWTDGIADTGSLLRFRFGSVRGRARRWLRWLGPLPLLITLVVALVPAWAPGAGQSTGIARDLLILLPTACTAFAFLTIVSAVSSGGGRELLPRDQGVAYPVSPVTEHLGALLLAPLNIAWLVQGWGVLGMMAYAVGPGTLVVGQAVVLLFLAVATAAGQVIGWTVELIRRGPHGILVHRALITLVFGAAAWVVLTERVIALLDASPAAHLAIGPGRAMAGDHSDVAVLLPALLGALVVLVAVGVLPAGAALRRVARDETRLESGRYRARRDLGSDFLTLVRVDLASVLRSVPLRRGLATLSLLPGLVSLAGAIDWDLLILLPGLVASGGALLFGVNAWCLDGRGALWRESLPADPGQVFAARAVVLTGLLLAASAASVLIGAARSGVPRPVELITFVCAWLVVSVQVVAASMRWSLRSPYAVDLRSARATPAPPVVMVGYSARLALSTTTVGLVFSTLASTPWWSISVLCAVPLLAWAIVRLVRSRRQWLDFETRSRIVGTVGA